MPIRFKLVLFAILCSLLPLVVVFSLAFNTARSSISETVERNLVFQAKEELYVIQRKLVQAKKLIISYGELAVMQNVTNDDLHGSIQQEITKIISSNRGFSQLLVANAKGNVIAATNKDLIGTNQYESWPHRVARLGLPYDGPIVKSDHLSYSEAKQGVPIYNSTGAKTLVGVLIVSINWDAMQAGIIKRSVFNGPQGQKRQIILQSRDNNDVLYSTKDATPPEGLLDSNPAQQTFQLSLGDKQYMTASIDSHAMDEFRDPNWRLHIALDSQIAFASADELLKKFCLTGALVLVLVSILAFWLARSIVSPVQSLVSNADRLASGDYDCPLNTTSGKDEIGHLSTSFEKMRIAIKDKEQKLKTETESSKQAAKAKGEFLANMSHEVRTPINGVLGMTELLLNTDLDQQQSRFASTIFRSGQSLLDVINDILDFSKIEAGKLELQHGAFDLRDLVEDCVELLAESAHRKGIELALHMGPDSHVAYQGDSSRLRQVILNLLGNAIKFTEQGEVKLVVKATDDENAITELRFEVIDTGIGIEEHKISTIFDSFVQADGSTTRQFGGTGLGLAISAKLAELMQGRIGAQSQFGKGSKFWFTAAVEKLSCSVEHAWHTDDALVQKNVLIVDDNNTNCEILQSQLLHWSAKPVITHSGADALIEIDETHKNGQAFDIVILDMHMPHMNGMELASAIRERSDADNTKLVLLSSVCDQLNLENCKSIGIDTLIAKPVRQPDLYNCLTAVINNTEAVQTNLVAERIEARQLQGRVLVAEDNPVNQDMMLEFLRLLGVDAVVVENGLQAIDAIVTGHFDVVLMDCQMPELDGFAATRAIRKSESAKGDGKRLPIVALTANALEGDRENCLACGMDEYLSKPVSSSQLREMLSNWLQTKESSQPDDAKEHFFSSQSASDTNSNTQAEDSEQILDSHVFNEVLMMATQAPGNFYEQLVNKYIDGSEEDINNIATGIEDQTPDTVSTSAHRLKSSSANWGAKKLASACQELELMAKAGSLAHASDNLETIRNEHKQVLTLLLAHKSKAA